MKKLWEMKNKKKNNKGFSLVELIVVIAIMAVLIAVLAPALLKYVENSRKSSDATVISGVVSTLQASVISDNVAGTEAGRAYTVTLDENGCGNVGNDDNGKLQAPLENAYSDLDDLKLKANTWRTAGVTVTITVFADGQTTISYNNADFNTYIGTNATGGNGGGGSTSTGTSTQ